MKLFINNEVVFVLFFFFFQAEDGIRDTSVTGVQTCALPILARGETREHLGGIVAEPGGQVRLHAGAKEGEPEHRRKVFRADGDRASRHELGRSEERRVGKECRSRWSTYQ